MRVAYREALTRAVTHESRHPASLAAAATAAAEAAEHEQIAITINLEPHEMQGAPAARPLRRSTWADAWC